MIFRDVEADLLLAEKSRGLVPPRCPPEFRPVRASAGFSLLELLAVLILMSLMLGLVVPGFYSSWQREQMRASVRQFAAALRLAQSTAITHRHRVRVFMNLTAGRYWLEGVARAGRLPVGTKVYEAHLVWQDQGRCQGYIAFYSDGSSSGGYLNLQSPQGQRYLLQIDRITGRVTIGAG